MPGPNEAITRKEMIDPALQRAGWDLDDPDQVRFEIPVDGSSPQAWSALKTELNRIKEVGGTYQVELPTGISDYALYRSNGEVLAIVEAKRTSTDSRLAEPQAEYYVDEIARRQSFRPFAFLSNGLDIYFLDAGVASKRLVAGFFSRSDLENLLWMRQNKMPLSQAAINTAITDRIYQQEAIRRVCEAFEQNKRRALLVMATGTGKTRTVISIIDIFLRSNQARRILFVADRDPLVEQTLRDGFKKFLPDDPSTRIHTQTLDTNNRLYVSTLQTLSLNYRRFTPGFFDLIIFDEVHRSIFNKWSEVLEYFDARMIGLTATPATFIDRNTFQSFGCTDGTPTFLYSYERAVKEGYLVDFTLYKARTHLQRLGIKGVDLSEEERNMLIEQGLDPDEISFEGTDLERKVSDRDMLRKQCQEILDVALNDRSGQQIGKTIIFAITQDHALRIADVFAEMYPQFHGLVRVITYKSDFKGKLIDDFKAKDLPRIAITVDLLETGIDIPEVVNLVFMKPVHSYIKLWQMIGRGTRPDAACHFHDRLPNGHKSEFLIIDFWENDFERAAEEEVASNTPVLCTVFNTRLKLLEYYLALP
ncbi:MAG: DEAD/DEAH box helicase family protein, partial [Chloroflexota bacterium]|nr:DEAD/DEAH box helicase family protein [Chloroflexota bacterium]